MQGDRRDTEAQEWVPSLEGGEFRRKTIFFAFTVKSGPSSNSLRQHRGGNETIIEKGKKRT